jgi:PAS domain-containing protein
MMLGLSLPLMQRIAPDDDSVSSLHDSAHRWCSLFENSTLGVAMADSVFRFLTANPAFLTMLGYSSEELQHLSFLDICDDEDCDERRVPLCELDEASGWLSFQRIAVVSAIELPGRSCACCE